MVNNYYVYISEMKKRFLLSIFTWVCCIVVGIYYQNNIIFLLIKPCLFKYKQTPFYFIYNNIGEPFYTNIQIIFFISNQMCMIIILYHIITFLTPGLYRKEYNNLQYFIKMIMFFFFLNIKICYDIFIPWSWNFFLELHNNQKVNFYFEAKFNEYLETVFILYKIIIIFTFLSVLFLLFLALKENIINFIKIYRKIIYIMIILISSIVTPPDIYNQLFLSFFFFIIFELYVCMSIFYKKYIK